MAGLVIERWRRRFALKNVLTGKYAAITYPTHARALEAVATFAAAFPHNPAYLADHDRPIHA